MRQLQYAKIAAVYLYFMFAAIVLCQFCGMCESAIAAITTTECNFEYDDRAPLYLHVMFAAIRFY